MRHQHFVPRTRFEFCKRKRGRVQGSAPETQLLAWRKFRLRTNDVEFSTTLSSMRRPMLTRWHSTPLLTFTHRVRVAAPWARHPPSGSASASCPIPKRSLRLASSSTSQLECGAALHDHLTKSPPPVTLALALRPACHNEHPWIEPSHSLSDVPLQGHHPMAFAVAELMDNSLRATRKRTASDRNIRVTLVLHPDRPEGLVSVSAQLKLHLPQIVGVRLVVLMWLGTIFLPALRCQVWDNGEGMSAEGLRQWAVMNLSMEDRGMQPTQPPDAGDTGAGSFLDAQLSFFGVRQPHVTAPVRCQSDAVVYGIVRT